MVRATADRAFLPVKNLLEQVGDMMILTGKTVLSAIRPPYPYGTEFVQQFMFALRLCWFPLLISTIAISYGAPGLQAGNFLILFGAVDRLGGSVVVHLSYRTLGLCHQRRRLLGSHRARLLLQGHDCLRRRRWRRSRRQPCGRDHLPGDRRPQLRLHPDAAGDASRDLGAQVTARP